MTQPRTRAEAALQLAGAVDYILAAADLTAEQKIASLRATYEAYGRPGAVNWQPPAEIEATR